MTMSDPVKVLTNEVSPGEAGMEPARLRLLDQHFERYVDDGRLPGFHLVVSRHGKVYGSAVRYRCVHHGHL